MQSGDLKHAAALTVLLAGAWSHAAYAGKISDFYASTHIGSHAAPSWPMTMAQSPARLPAPAFGSAARPSPFLAFNPAPQGPEGSSAPQGGISCVPFARAATGMDVKGNASAWWDNAAGLYSRGRTPERGSVLSFRASSRMPLGHVAVVAAIVSSRLIMIDHANWAGSRGRVSRGVFVVDISPGNDWTQVRLELSKSGDFGSGYPTNGFIYNRPDNGVTVLTEGRKRYPATGYDEVALAGRGP